MRDYKRNTNKNGCLVPFKKKNHPSTNRNHSHRSYPVDSRNSRNYSPINYSPFSQNIIQGNLHNRNNDFSGYVKREMVMKDSHGNVKMARETQFFNSMKHIGNVHIDD